MNIFVTGTDTGIGKTVVAALLSVVLKRKYWKPIQCGVSPSTDSEWVARYIGADQVIPEVYKFKKLVSPHLAAKLDEGLDEIIIDTHKIFSVAKNISAPLVIEGAGGLLVPLNDHEFMIDLIAKFKCTCVLVAKSTLGTINHTLLSLAALREKGIEPSGVILVGPLNLDNKLSIQKYGKINVLGEIPWFEKLDFLAFSEMKEIMKEAVLKIE